MISERESAKRDYRYKDFGIYLKKMVEEHDISSSRLSGFTNTDRSTIYQIYSGNRLPTVGFLRSLAVKLRMTVEEQQRLYHRYHIARDGEWKTKCVRAAAGCISALHDVGADDGDAAAVLSAPLSLKDEGALASCRGVCAIESRLLFLLQRELSQSGRPHIRLFLTGENLRRVRMLLSMSSAFGRKPEEPAPLVEQLLCIRANADFQVETDPLEYVRPFRAAIALYGNDHLDYRPRMVYSNPIAMPLSGAMYSNYILFSDACLYLNADGNEGMQINDAGAIAQQAYMFDRVMRSAADMLLPADRLTGAMRQLFKYTGPGRGPRIRISHTPPLFNAYSAELIENCVRADIPGHEEISSYAQLMYGNPALTSEDLLFFSRSGLEKFAETGLLDDAPPAYTRPVPPEERYRLLKECYELYLSGRFQFALLDEQLFKLAPYFIVYMDENSVLITDQRFERRFNMLHITDSVLVRLFSEFGWTLLKSEHIYSREETLKIWKALLDRMQAELP